MLPREGVTQEMGSCPIPSSAYIYLDIYIWYIQLFRYVQPRTPDIEGSIPGSAVQPVP